MKEEETSSIEKGGDSESPNSSSNSNHEEQVKGSSSSSSSSKSNKGKSCKGCLYYSSALKSNSRNPLCVGITRSLPQVPRYIVGESEMEASKEGRRFTDFRYACVGYSVYSDGKDSSTDTPETRAELPACVGIEVLVDKRVTNADSVPAHAHNREDGHQSPQPRAHRPQHSVEDEFLSRFSRNASLVANGVVKNMRKVGNHVKETLDDILYPYRRRPK